MSNVTTGANTGHHLDTHANTDRRTARRVSTETKSSYKTTELIAYVVAVLGVLIASAMVDTSDFGAQEAWFYVTLLTVAVSGTGPTSPAPEVVTYERRGAIGCSSSSATASDAPHPCWSPLL